MVTDITWEEFCNIYYETAREWAKIQLLKQKKLLGGLDRHVDEDYVIDETVLSSLEKTYASYSAARGTKVTTLLSRIIHNRLVDVLEAENKQGAKKDDIENAGRNLSDFLRAQTLEVPRQNLLAKMMEAVRKLPASDQVIINCYLADTKTFVSEASGILKISENYVRVRKNRILHTLRELMGSTMAEYQEWKFSGSFKGYIQDYFISDNTDKQYKLKIDINCIQPDINIAGIATGLLSMSAMIDNN